MPAGLPAVWLDVFNLDDQFFRARRTVAEGYQDLRLELANLISKLAGDLRRADKQLAILDFDLSALTYC